MKYSHQMTLPVLSVNRGCKFLSVATAPLVLFFFIAFFASVAGAQTASPEKRIEMMITGGEYAGAMRMLDSLITGHPENGNLYRLEGYCWHQQGKINEAIEQFKKEADRERCDTCHAALDSLANLCLEKKDDTRAKKYFEMAAERGSLEGRRGIALIWMYQGDERAKEGDGISALEAFEKAAQYYEDTLIYRRLLIGYVSIQNYEKAEEVCLKALKLFPSFEPSAMFLSNRYYNQGILKFTSGNYREAIELLSKSFDLDPGQTKALLSIGYCYEKLNDTERAFANYSNAMFDSSVMPTATIAISRIFRSRGKINEAYQMLIKSINAAPMNMESWDEIGRLYHDLGKRDEFIECWKAKALLGDEDAYSDLMKWDIPDDVFHPAQLSWLKVNPFLSETEPPDFVPVDKMPVPITTMQPEYPEVARRAGVEGTVWVKLLINKNGIPTKALIQKSDAEIFNTVSIFAAMQFRFSPAFINGKQVSVWASIPFRFKLNR